MSCIKSIFKCNFTETGESFCEKNISSLREKIMDIEIELKSFQVAHDLEIKRIEDKLIHQIQILTTKVDSLLFHIKS